jgi:hypothetical protein
MLTFYGLNLCMELQTGTRGLAKRHKPSPDNHTLSADTGAWVGDAEHLSTVVSEKRTGVLAIAHLPKAFLAMLRLHPAPQQLQHWCTVSRCRHRSSGRVSGDQRERPNAWELDP